MSGPFQDVFVPMIDACVCFEDMWNGVVIRAVVDIGLVADDPIANSVLIDFLVIGLAL